jgi:tRNA G18 (ribose-2'-O)-methylase SpoU
MEDERIVGVPPYPKPWPNDTRLDPALLEHGDTRNVLDEYRYWKNEAIVTDLDQKRSHMHIAIENWQHDFNIGTIVRNANAFNASTVHIIGKRKWNRRGAMVTDRYLHIEHHPTVPDFIVTMKKIEKTIIAVDIVENAQPLAKTKLPMNCVLVFGGEGPGLSHELRGEAAMTIAIEQFGSTRSVNVGVASGIVMYAWIRQHVLGKQT